MGKTICTSSTICQKVYYKYKSDKKPTQINIYFYHKRKEIQEIRSSSYIKATLASFVAFHARLSLFFCIFSYVLLGNNISTQKVVEIVTTDVTYNVCKINTISGFCHNNVLQNNAVNVDNMFPSRY